MTTRFQWLCSMSLLGTMSGCATNVESSHEPVAASTDPLTTSGYSSVAFEELATSTGEPVPKLSHSDRS
jgi:hypothetical protein